MLEQETKERGQARLSSSESKQVRTAMRFRSPVIYEVIRRQGQEELHRPSLSLCVAGIAAGMAMGFSVLAEALLHDSLPHSDWSVLVERLGYSLGFLIVIMARLQLFTENTITAVLPICAYPTGRNFLAVARLWSIVLAGNLVGTLIFAAFIRYTRALSPADFAAFVAVSERLLNVGFLHATAGGIVSGFLIACLVWVAPIVQAAEFWMILVITYIIALGGFSHVIVGSTEAWFLVLNGSASIGRVFGTYVLGAFIGNVIGGTGLFTLLAYTQVFTELKEKGESAEEEEAEAELEANALEADSPSQENSEPA